MATQVFIHYASGLSEQLRLRLESRMLEAECEVIRSFKMIELVGGAYDSNASDLKSTGRGRRLVEMSADQVRSTVAESAAAFVIIGPVSTPRGDHPNLALILERLRQDPNSGSSRLSRPVRLRKRSQRRPCFLKGLRPVVLNGGSRMKNASANYSSGQAATVPPAA